MFNHRKLAEHIPEDNVEEMFEVCLAEVRGSAWKFLESIYKQFEETGELTDFQHQALTKFYKRVKKDVNYGT